MYLTGKLFWWNNCETKLIWITTKQLIYCHTDRNIMSKCTSFLLSTFLIFHKSVGFIFD